MADSMNDSTAMNSPRGKVSSSSASLYLESLLVSRVTILKFAYGSATRSTLKSTPELRRGPMMRLPLCRMVLLAIRTRTVVPSTASNDGTIELITILY